LSPTYVDACDTRLSNVARWANHNFIPNMERRTQRWPNRAVKLFAVRDIEVGDELCWDYGKNYWRGREELVK